MTSNNVITSNISPKDAIAGEYVMKKNVLAAVEHLPTVNKYIKPGTPVCLFKTYHGIDRLLREGVLDLNEVVSVPARDGINQAYTFSMYAEHPRVAAGEVFITYLLIVPRYPVQHPWHGVYVGWGIAWKGAMITYTDIQGGTTKVLRDLEGNIHALTPARANLNPASL